MREKDISTRRFKIANKFCRCQNSCLHRADVKNLLIQRHPSRTSLIILPSTQVARFLRKYDFFCTAGRQSLQNQLPTLEYNMVRLYK